MSLLAVLDKNIAWDVLAECDPKWIAEMRDARNDVAAMIDLLERMSCGAFNIGGWAEDINELLAAANRPRQRRNPQQRRASQPAECD